MPDMAFVFLAPFRKLAPLLLVVMMLAIAGCPPPIDNTPGDTLPEALFTATPLQGEAPLTVQFTDISQSTTTLLSWNWQFGDGSSSSLANPTHTYVQSGTYSVTLTVFNAIGSDVLTIQNFITLEPAQSFGFLDAAGGSFSSAG